jgi:hypothetical protein
MYMSILIMIKVKVKNAKPKPKSMNITRFFKYPPNIGREIVMHPGTSQSLVSLYVGRIIWTRCKDQKPKDQFETN